MGPSEVLVILIILGIFAFPTIMGSYRAFTTGRTGWGVAILAGWLAGLGWLVGWIFLIGPGRKTVPA